MKIEVVDSPDAFAQRAAGLVRDAVRSRPGAAIGLPTGETPVGMYGALGAGLSDAAWFAIDELHGVAPAHPATNASYLRHLAPALSVRLLDSDAEDGEAECAAFAAEIEVAGGLDLVILGISTNGHIAFNEPGSTFDSRARRVALAEATRRAYAPRFASLDEVPTHGLTLGVADLLSARRVLLLARGDEKAKIVAAAIEGPVTTDVPASALQRHDDVIVLLDAAAASSLSRPSTSSG